MVERNKHDAWGDKVSLFYREQIKKANEANDDDTAWTLYSVQKKVGTKSPLTKRNVTWAFDTGSNARHGSIRAPIYVGGGKAHGPKPRSYAQRPPRKMRLGALRSALSLKLKEGNLTVVDSFELKEIKTKALADVLKSLKVGAALIVDATENENLRLSIRNLPGNQFLPPEGVNLYDLLRHEHLILTKQAVAALENRFGKGLNDAS